MTADRPTTEPRPTTLDDLIRAARDWGIEEASQFSLPSTLAAHREEVEDIRAAIEAEAAQGAAPLACNNPRHDEIEAWYRQALELAAPRAEGLDVDDLIDNMPIAVLATDGGPAVAYAMRVEAYLRDRLSTRPSDERVPESECKRFRHDEHCDHFTD